MAGRLVFCLIPFLGLPRRGLGRIPSGHLNRNRVQRRGYAAVHASSACLSLVTPMPQLMGPMDCRSFRKHHLAYLDDTLSGDQMGAAQRHILSCDACASHDTLVRRSLMVARNIPTIAPSADFHARLKARLAECREERESGREFDAAEVPGADFDHSTSFMSSAAGWRSPRMMVAVAASAVIGMMLWRGTTPASAPLVAMKPVIATKPAPPAVRLASPALLQAMAPGSPVWGAAIIIDDLPSQFVKVDYSMSVDGR